MTGTWPLRDALDWKSQLGLSAGFAAVLCLALVFPIDDCVVGTLGGLSAVLRTVWALTTGSATLVSFVLAMRKYRAEVAESGSDESTDSHTAIHVDSVEGDVDLNVTLTDAHTPTSNSEATVDTNADSPGDTDESAE